jgi:hypothetical protein
VLWFPTHSAEKSGMDGARRAEACSNVRDKSLTYHSAERAEWMGHGALRLERSCSTKLSTQIAVEKFFFHQNENAAWKKMRRAAAPEEKIP